MTVARSEAIADVSEVIGRKAALNLAWEFRGERLFVPKDPAREPRIVAAIGEEAAARFSDIFYGTTIYMPGREATRMKVLELDAAGVTRRDIGRQLHITERQVYRLLKEAAQGRDDVL